MTPIGLVVSMMTALISTAEGETWPPDEIEAADTAALLAIFRLDVIAHWELEEETDSPLKLRVFKKSGEYREKLKELKKLREEMKGRAVFVPVVDGSQGVKLRYDLRRKALAVPTGDNRDEERALRSVSGVLFAGCQYSYRSIGPWAPGFKDEHLLVAVSEKRALEIENLDNPKVYIAFHPKGTKTVRGQITARLNEYVPGSEMTTRFSNEVLTVRDYRIFIVNQEDTIVLDSGWRR